MIAMSTAKQNVEASVPAQGERGSPIDRVHLARMTLGERRLECEVLALFVRQADMLLQRMGRVEPKAVAAAAHTLKGSARGIGAWQVAGAAERVERAKPAGLNRALAELGVTIDEARAVIAVLLREH
jgi:HPt (histidine-containing phosphotransfer) domain-containing protein